MVTLVIVFSSTQVLGVRYCGTLPPDVILTESSTLIVHLHSDNVMKVSGFNASYYQIERKGRNATFMKMCSTGGFSGHCFILGHRRN